MEGQSHTRDDSSRCFPRHSSSFVVVAILPLQSKVIESGGDIYIYT